MDIDTLLEILNRIKASSSANLVEVALDTDGPGYYHIISVSVFSGLVILNAEPRD